MNSSIENTIGERKRPSENSLGVIPKNSFLMLNRNSALGSYCVDQDEQESQKFEEEKECASPP